MARSNSDDSYADPQSQTVRELYGPLIPAEVDGLSDWDPALAPEGFVPEAAPDGRPFHTAAWDGGLSDLRVAPDLYDTAPGAPVVLVYASVQGAAQVFSGEIVHTHGRRLKLEGEGGTTRTVHEADNAGRENAVHGDNGAYIGEMCEVRLVPTEERLDASGPAKSGSKQR